MADGQRDLSKLGQWATPSAPAPKGVKNPAVPAGLKDDFKKSAGLSRTSPHADLSDIQPMHGLPREDFVHRLPKSKEERACNCFIVFVTFTLVIMAIGGPVYAFTAVSCVSTATCRIVGLLGLSGASCLEGPGEESQYLMHGEKCTVQCPDGLEPTVPVLECDDGVTKGAETFSCAPPKPPPPSGDLVGGLVSGAIVGGELATACRRAGQANLRCEGRPGGTAILLVMPGLTPSECQDLLDECRLVSSEFQFLDFETGAGSTTLDPTIYGPQNPVKGTCIFE